MERPAMTAFAAHVESCHFCASPHAACADGLHLCRAAMIELINATRNPDARAIATAALADLDARDDAA